MNYGKTKKQERKTPFRRHGQVSVQFHWIFIIIAGAVILAFFIGVVFKQKAISEQKISIAIVTELEPIIAGAGVAEDTFNKVDIPKADIEFICNGDYSEYSVKGTGIHNEIPTEVIFSSDMVKGKTLYIWTLGWQMPYRVVNFIMITSPNIRYEFVYGEQDKGLAKRIYMDFPKELNKGALTPRKALDDIENLGYDKTRFIFINCEPDVPSDFEKMPSDAVSALKITSDAVKFYRKFGRDFAEEIGGEFPVRNSFTDKDPMLYGAVFSENSEMYLCNMRKAFKRLNIITGIIEDRAKKVKGIYSPEEACFGLYGVGVDYLSDFRAISAECYERFSAGCFFDLYQKANDILDLNDRLLRHDCILVY